MILVLTCADTKWTTKRRLIRRTLPQKKTKIFYYHMLQQLTNGGEGSRFFLVFGLFALSGVSAAYGNGGG